ncbi:CoA transferase [Haliea sp. E1-2-M8]|uniref:CaiB/BaiF CoA transferase family protein n=1 Tax=Haliea sp. E1-2-M8 TaxID=3064706 RepID=UPI002728DB22|nr:CoA transferase [Haliea sp. E1-2-M8]MDO8864013.1 CoA transferase [Haliea sp. E1-2-M8]
MTGPLSGFRILDLSAVLSGPLATTSLCDQGAEVIKVEAFTGDVIRHTQSSQDGLTTLFVSSNRGKKAIAIDLKTDAGIGIIKRMVQDVDVVVQNFRPGAIERMGLGYDVLRAINPAIVYCSISGFGSKGPYVNRRVYDPIVQGLSGINFVQGGPDGPPQMIQATLADVVAAITASQSITAALLSREKTGEGQHVTVAMIDALISLTWPSAMVGNMMVDREAREPRAPYRGNDLIFKTADGYITAAAVSESEWQGLCQAVGREDWLQHERLNTPAGRTTNTRTLSELLSPIILTKSSRHWLELLDRNGVPCGRVITCAEVPDDEQIIVNELIEVLDHPIIGKIRQSRPAARFSATPAKIQGFAPRLGEHSKEILAQFGFSEDEICDLFASDIVR